MENDDMNDTSPPSAQPFFVHGGFPFVFLPSTLAGGFNFTNHHTHVSSADDQSTSESKKKAENNENDDDDEEERTETIDDDEGDRKDENDESSDEKSNLRISQPKYSQLLKELDFSQARMVDVTNLLTNELDQPDSPSIHEDNDNDNKRQTTDDEKYQSVSSARSTPSQDELSNAPTIDNNDKTKEEIQLLDAVQEIENDLNNLATIIQEAANDKNPSGEEDKFTSQKKGTFDEEDDTSKQATQDYDLHENEQENIVSSSKSHKVQHIVNQHTFDLVDENKPTISQLTQDIEPQKSPATQQDEKEQEQQPQSSPVTWENLVFGTRVAEQISHEGVSSEPVIESHSTPKRTPQPQPRPADSSDEKSKPRTSSFTKQKLPSRQRQVISSSNSSSDTDSIVEYALHRSKEKHSASFQNKQHKVPLIPSQTLRQDSQATLIDENLDELSSQLRHVLHDQERYTSNGTGKDERTFDGLGTLSFPLSPPDILSTAIIDDELLNRQNEDMLRNLSNQRPSHSQHRSRHSTYAPQRSSSHRKKSHHHHQQKYSTSQQIDPAEEINARNTDDDWLTMLDRLEREHQARIEQQRKQYEDYMHTLEDKMKRRYDDVTLLTHGSQESRSEDYDNMIHTKRVPTSVPTDSNVGKHYSHTYRPVVTDLVSHYYPADSTLNVLSSEKKRTVITDYVPSSQSRDETFNFRPDLSSRHSKHIDDIKLRHEYEVNDLRSQLNRSRLSGHTSSVVRQSMGTIERINSDNIRLRDELNGARHSLKVSDDENVALKRQLDELREQINHKDLDLKTHYRTIANLERQLNESENVKERHNEKLRHAERQASLYRDENEKLKIDLNRTRERVLRLEERSREQENENETLRRQLFLLESDNNRIKNRLPDDRKLTASKSITISPSQDYHHITVTNTTKHSSSTMSTPRDGIIDSARYQPSDKGTSYHSPRPLSRIADYLAEKCIPSQLHVSPSRHVYSPKKSSPTRRRTESVPRRDSFDRQTRQTEQLEQKFDHLLKKKRDLEARLHRIPSRGLTNTDHQLYDVLEREIERVDQQIMTVKLDLRKSNTLRTY